MKVPQTVIAEYDEEKKHVHLVLWRAGSRRGREFEQRLNHGPVFVVLLMTA